VKRHFIILFIAAILVAPFVLTTISASASDPMFDAKAKIEARLKAIEGARSLHGEAVTSKALYERLTKMISRKAGKTANPFDVIDIMVTFDADETAGTIDTVVTETIKATEDGLDFAEFSLDALDSFSVEDGGGNPVDFVYEPATYVATVTLPTVLNEGDEQVLVFKNAGTPNCDPDDFWGMTSCMVSEDIVFFVAPEWMATKVPYTMEDLYQNAPLTVDVTTPAGYVAAGSADLESIETSGDELIHHFAGHFGVSYFDRYFALAYAPFDIFQTTTADGGKPVKTFIHTGVTDFGQNWADICADVIDYYEDIYSPYIYNKHDVIQTINEFGGGAGPQSAALYYADALTTDPASWMSESVFSHEIGHQWWGDMIRLGDNYSPWLLEGFAEYSSRLYAYQASDSDLVNYLYDNYFHIFQMGIDHSDEPAMSSYDILSVDSLLYQAVTYWKGAHVLRMLQWKLGDSAFFDAMNHYAQSYSSDVSDELVDPDKFQDAAEAASGEDLDDFFQTWVYGTGFPIYRYAAQFDETEGGYSVRVKVDQVQETEQIYDLPMEVAIWVGEETEPRIYTIQFDGKTASGLWVLEEAPHALYIDASSWIWGDKIPALAGDVDSNNEVDGLDLIYVAWSQGGKIMDYDHWNYYVETDLNRDGTVDQDDLDTMLNTFGKKGAINE